MSTFLCGTEGIINIRHVYTYGFTYTTSFQVKATDTDIKYNLWPLFLFYSRQNYKMKLKENQYHAQTGDDDVQMTHFNLNCISVKQAKGRSKCKRVAFHELAVP